MAEYIDKYAVLEKCKYDYLDEEGRYDYFVLVSDIKAVLPADVRSVERAEWLVRTDADGKTYGVCSQCGYKQYAGHLKYCPNCGADMKSGDAE